MRKDAGLISTLRASASGTILIPAGGSLPAQLWQSQAASGAAADAGAAGADGAAAAAAKGAPGADAGAADAGAAGKGADADAAAQAAIDKLKAPVSEADKAAAKAQGGADSRATKPDYLTDDFWDADKGEVKADALKDALANLSAVREAKDYVIDVPAEMRKEMGLKDGESAFDPEAPMVKLLPEILSELKVDPKAVPAVMAKIAAVLQAEDKQLEALTIEEVKKLGDNGPQRLLAMRNAIVGHLGDDADAFLSVFGRVGASALTGLEKILNKAGGAAAFDGSGGGGKKSSLPGEVGSTEQIAAIFEANAQKPRGFWRNRGA